MVTYLLVGQDLTVTACGPDLEFWALAAEANLTGQALTELVIELVGVEALLQEILDGSREKLALPNLSRPAAGGELRYFDLHVSLCSALDSTLIVILTDVSERARDRQRIWQQRNELILLSADLQSRNEELNAFAHTLAHNLANLLTRFLSFSQLLEVKYAGLLEEPGKKLVRGICEAGFQMQEIVRALLLLATVPRSEVAIGPLDMECIALAATKRLENVILETGAEVIMPGAWPAALGYAPWLEEVWENYISNALKYGGDSPRVELGGSEMDQQVRFWVRDRGPGIPPERQATLFSSTPRLDPSRTSGHGLGLSIVKRIVEKLGGKVGVQSQAGEGSLFWFSLPAAAPPEK